MKDLILKIAQKYNKDITPENFYKYFPDEESFFKKHGSEFKKAQAGWAGPANQNPALQFFPQGMSTTYGDVSVMAPFPKRLPTNIDPYVIPI